MTAPVEQWLCVACGGFGAARDLLTDRLILAADVDALCHRCHGRGVTTRRPEADGVPTPVQETLL